MHRPYRLENCGDAVEPKARSQPNGTRLAARSSGGCGLGLAGVGAFVSRSPLSARSTSCGLEAALSVRGNDGAEARTIEQVVIATIVRRTASLRISPYHPEAHVNKRAGLTIVPSKAATIFTGKIRCLVPRNDLREQQVLR
jgi:hypothetical protein